MMTKTIINIHYTAKIPLIECNEDAQRLKSIPSKSFNFLSTNRVDNNKSNSAEQSTQLLPPPLPANPPPQLLNQQFISQNDDTLGVITQRQWRTTKNPSSIDSSSNNKSKSVMSAKVETTVRQWSTPIEKVIEGQPPRPEDHPTVIHGEAQKSVIQSITPSYKSVAEKQVQKIDFGSDLNLPEAVGDYKVKETQDHFKLQIIDPKITSNASMPAHHREIPRIQRRNLDFPSEHSKRSFLKLEPMQQRKLRAVETRPITTSAYLTESLDRHRDMEASRLKDYLKARENDANKPWDKPQWPGPKATKPNDQTLKELAEIKKTIETLQKTTIGGPKNNSDLDQLARLNEKLLERSRGRRADYKLVDSEIVKTAPEPVPVTVKEQIRDMLESRISNDTSVNSTIPQQDRSGYVTDASSATWQFSSHSFSPRSVVSVNGGGAKDGLLKVRTDLSPGLWRTLSRSNAAVQTAHIESEKQHWPYMPARLGPVTDSAQSTMTREFNENFERSIERYASLPTLHSDTRGTLIKIKDDKPRGIMKRRELETKDQMMYAEEPRQVARTDHWDEQRVAAAKPKITETVQRVEEHKRIEEIERRVQRKEKKEKKHRSSHRSYHHRGGGNREAYGYNSYSDEGYRSNSLSRQNGYLPAHESYMRSVTTRREKDGRYHDDGRLITNGNLSNGRYGSSLSDSLRRGELRYNPNGDIREVHHSSSGRNERIHKSLSNRDVYDSGSGVNYDGDYHRSSSYRRGSQQSGGPFIEFPPTLPRDRDAPIPPPHRGRAPSDDFYRPIIKSRSYADWDEGRGFSQSIRRRNDDMVRLENEFRDSLLMPLPNMTNSTGGNMYERDHRHEQIPGGYETYDREVKSNSGRRINKDGNPTDFKEESQECSYTRETESDRRR